MALSGDDRECAVLAERAGDLAYLADATAKAKKLYGRASACQRSVGAPGRSWASSPRPRRRCQRRDNRARRPFLARGSSTAPRQE